MLQIVETQKTLNGECNAWGQGTPCFLIRFAGCNLRCAYCDAERAQSMLAGKPSTVDEVIALIDGNVPPNGIILLTGGEPLFQPQSELFQIIFKMPDRKFVIETNGTLPLADMEALLAPDSTYQYNNVSLVVDCKLPSSGIDRDWNNPESFIPVTIPPDEYDNEMDFIKFVLDMGSIESYTKDLDAIRSAVDFLHFRGYRGRYALSPIFPRGGTFVLHDKRYQRVPSDYYASNIVTNLVEFMHEMQAQGIPMAVQVQLHKLLGIA